MPVPYRILPSQEWLLAKFSYDPVSGTLTRKSNGKSALALQSGGYRQVAINGDQYLAHRVIWKMMTGQDVPSVDHRNTIRHDNRWANLRSAAGNQNHVNKSLTVQNTSGLKGACYCKQTGLWKSTIKVGAKQKWLGRHLTKEAAHLAYVEAAKKYHGEYANDGRGEIG